MEIDKGTHLDRTKSATSNGVFGNPPTGDSSVLPQPLLRQPALMKPDWLPEGLFPEVDQLREEHHEHLASVSEAAGKVKELKESYDAEDAARAEALRVGDEVPPVTSSSERQDTIDAAEAEREATLARFGDFIAQAAVTFRGKEIDWRVEFSRRTAEAEQKQEEAKRMLAEADQEVARVKRLELWLERTIRPRAGRYESAPSLERVPDLVEA